MESKVGYLLSGPVPVSTGQFLVTTNSVMMLTLLPTEFNLECFWHLESVGVTPPNDCSKDSLLNRYSTSCVSRDDDGAYVARFPWKLNHLDLPTNYTVAKQRTKQLINRLSELLKMYS